MAIQKLPHRVLMTVTNVSLASKPFMPAMNCARPFRACQLALHQVQCHGDQPLLNDHSPPKIATNGKKMVGLSSFPHQSAI